MKQNKKNRTVVIGIVVLVLAVVTSALAGMTYAKYTSNVSGNDQATVAQWAWNINTKDVVAATPATFSFNLFDTVTDDASFGADDANVNDDREGATLIAPGTGGKFEYTVTNKSEVKGNYYLALSETNLGGIPVLYSTDGTTFKSLADLNTALATVTELEAGAADTTKTIYWKWAFDGNDTDDTALGIAGSATLQVTATINFTQVD